MADCSCSAQLHVLFTHTNAVMFKNSKSLRMIKVNVNHANTSTRCPYLLQQTDHVGVLAHSQAQWHGQSLLILKATGIELGPEFHLQLTVFFLRELELCHAALQLQGGQTGGVAQISTSNSYLSPLKMHLRRHQNNSPHSLQPRSPPFSERPKTDR